MFINVFKSSHCTQNRKPISIIISYHKGLSNRTLILIMILFDILFVNTLKEPAILVMNDRLIGRPKTLL